MLLQAHELGSVAHQRRLAAFTLDSSGRLQEHRAPLCPHGELSFTFSPIFTLIPVRNYRGLIAISGHVVETGSTPGWAVGGHPYAPFLPPDTAGAGAEPSAGAAATKKQRTELQVQHFCFKRNSQHDWLAQNYFQLKALSSEG